mmetsp:Transcript_9959/g.24012  ORF Transcript_9959/g.24012 Transcript_9959/m.24012 type:complete len:233 (+) Transcript_9959:356-1054(+)
MFVCSHVDGDCFSFACLGVTCLFECISVCLRDGILRQKNNHGVRCTSSVIGRKSIVKSQGALRSNHFDDTIRHALVGHFPCDGIGSLGHKSALNQVKRHGKKGRCETSTQGSQNSGRQFWSVCHRIPKKTSIHFLELIVTRHHSNIHGHSSQNVRQNTLVEGTKSLFLRGTHQRVKHIFVVSSVFWFGHSICLQSHQRNIEGTSDRYGNRPTQHARRSFLSEADRLPIVLFD